MSMFRACRSCGRKDFTSPRCSNLGFTSGHYGDVPCNLCFRLHCQSCGFPLKAAETPERVLAETEEETQ